ncbi:MAG: SDR family oxidoreductase [Anaerolineae bacterium]|nr:SDR family oxidoreductase [Anaerolineae bacterium]
MDRFKDKVAVITGGSRGIGYAIAEAFVREGAYVVIGSVNAERGKAACRALRECGGVVEFVQADVSVRDDAERLIATTIERFGRLDTLINNAGRHEKAPFCDESEALWDRMYRANVLGTALPSQAAVRYMREHGGGAIVHVSSKAGVVGEPGHAAYSAAKGAVISMTRAMAVELAPYKIRVNVVCPGPVVSDMFLEAVPLKENQDKLAAAAPLGRVGVPEDIAGAVLYFASAESDLCTGQALSLDGGLSLLL